MLAMEAASARKPTSQQRVPAGLQARRLAWIVVDEVLRNGRALDEVFERAARAAALEHRDAALARAIAVVTFRRFGTIRQALLDRMAKRLPKEERALTLLATAAAQVLFLDVPDHAAVDVTVGLTRSERPLQHLGGLANAILRRIAREREEILAGADPLETDTPDWLASRWRAHYGENAARAIAAAHGRGGAVDLTVKDDPAGWAERLSAILLATGAVRLVERGDLRELPGYADGAWWVQDAAAALPARLLDAKRGERVADLCAAPGGKTAQLAAAGAHVLAVDRSVPRLKRLAENMERLKLSVETQVADALALEAEPLDAVLLDAPCSATGTIRRHPDVPWIKSEDDLRKLAGLQGRLLDKAADLTRPGGRLVYCTCSLEPEEGEHQAAAFLKRRPDFRRAPVAPEELPGLPEAVTPEGDVRTLPHYGGAALGAAGLDGFFIARFSRANS
jgi:16S rRNA (cytosine967-C5)-methyltransferase